MLAKRVIAAVLLVAVGLLPLGCVSIAGTGGAGGSTQAQGSASSATSGSGSASASTGSATAGGSTGSATTAAQAQTIKVGEALVIPLAEITERASFYPLTVDGTAMEVLAVKAPDGTVRTAFNTCEVCFDSGRGYYKQEGKVLVCQNCGNRFATSAIEVQANGCNPWPIFAKDKTQTEQDISISYSVLSASKKVFDNWKR